MQDKSSLCEDSTESSKTSTDSKTSTTSSSSTISSKSSSENENDELEKVIYQDDGITGETIESETIESGATTTLKIVPYLLSLLCILLVAYFIRKNGKYKRET